MNTSSGKDISLKKKSLAISNSKTTAITINSTKQSSGDVNLPTIQNKNRLAAIDDDNKEDFDEKVPQKPRNIKRASSDEDDG